GVTDKAVIKDVEFENIHYVVEAGADVSSIGANYGGVVGYASLTNLYGVKVSGTIEARLFESNVASIGGIAGALDVYDAKQPRIAYSENCYANVNIIAGAFEDMDVEPSLVGAMVGGLYGFISNSGSAVALVNNASSGSIAGGQYVGGLVAYLESDNVSVINCASNMTVKATAKNSSSYAGGLVGATVRNIIIIDSVFYGTVRGSRPTAVNTSGYAGEIIGYAWDDDYEFTYTAGIAVVNTYHNATLQNAQNRTTYGTKLEQAPTLQWAVTTLGWDAESWTDNNGFVPTSVYAADLRSSATLTLASGNDKTADVREIQGVGGYSVLGSLDALNSADGQVFYAWAIADGVWYRYYMPLVKDVTLNARWQDVSDIVGVYVGTYEYYTGSDAGVIQLNDNGTCQWLSSGSVNGVYRYDGEHIVMVFFNALDEISGTMSGGKMEFMIAQGGTAEIPYTFIKSDLRYFGEYFSEDGDCVVFGGEDLLSINSPVIGTDFYLARFVENGDTLTLTSNWLSNTYSSMTITINEDLTITVNFVGKDPSKSINKVFSKLGTPDYTGEAFVGRYAVSYLAKGDDPYQSVYQLQLNADGSASLWWTIRRTDADGTPSVLWDEYETKGVYYVFGDTVKVSVEGNMSSFTFDAEAGILHGVYNRGVVRNAILIKLADGTEVRDTEIKGFVIDKNIDNVVFVSGDKKFLMKDGVWKQDAVIIGEFNTGSRITIDGVDYLVRYKSYNGNSRWPEYLLDTIGEEEGTYTRNGVSLTLNGIGDINGDVKGNYRVYGKLVSAVLDDDTVFVFDYTAAKAAGGAITDAQHDGYQGVWYMDCTVSVNEWIDDKTQADKKTEVFIEKYYKFFLDGFGHTALVYYSNDYREYRYGWGLDGTGWGSYTKPATGIHVYYKESETGDVVFYYNMALA
ncbi:MAG: hypothetical protein K2M36_01140, partial [Clostridia bacterium]|nr:hypothetical protein [Clostridia bacterium]